MASDDVVLTSNLHPKETHLHLCCFIDGGARPGVKNDGMGDRIVEFKKIGKDIYWKKIIGWPLVWNEGLKLYLVVMGTPSLIPEGKPNK